MILMKRGFLQALAVAAYCNLVGLFMFNIGKILPKGDNFLAPVLALMLLSVSVLFCGLAVFYKPYILFFAGKKKEAINLVLSTAMFLFLFFLLTLGILFTLR